MTKASDIEKLTKELVNRPSVTGTRSGGNEKLLAEWIAAWFTDRNISCALQEIPDGRKNVFAYLPGTSRKTIVLMGHFDTVPPSPGQVTGSPDGSDDGYLYGRGSLDMKSGVAVVMKLMESWRKSPDPPAISVLFVATCDEEVESMGVLEAVGFISELREGTSPRATSLMGGSPCDFLGVINVDYTTERYPGDPDYHVWNGTVGKMLAGVYVRGYQTHAGEYFRGFHAMGLLSRMIIAIDGNSTLAGPAPPPVTLKVSDAKEEYNVMTSPSGWAYFNIFSTGTTPSQTMRGLKEISDRVIAEHLAELNNGYEAYCNSADVPVGGIAWEVNTRSWSEIYSSAIAAAGLETVEALCAETMSPDRPGDIREKCFTLLERLLALPGDRDPVVVLMFLPPYYPYVSPDAGSLRREVDRAIASILAAGDVSISVENFYPYISDMSYLRIEAEILETLGELTSEMPAWGRGYHLDFDTIARVNLPVINAGPYGFGAHQPEERVEKKYSFGILPKLLDSLVRGY